MKRFYFISLMLVGFISISNGQEASRVVVTDGYDGYVQNSINRPFVRKIPGGGIINVNYVGPEWEQNLERKNAVEHACRIWEEQLPTSLPITISVEFGTMARTQLASAACNYSPSNRNDFRTVVKRKALAGSEMPILDENFFTVPDGVITFNDKDIFSYSLNEVQEDKYDFVTVVLQQFAKILGINTDFKANITNKYLMYSTNLNEFEKLMLWLVKDKYDAYVRATSNNFYLNFNGIAVRYKVYTPTVFRDNVSLSYLDKDPSNTETMLLQPDLPRGTSIRNIGDAALYILQDIGYARAIAVGLGSSSGDANPASTANIIPYSLNSTFTSSKKADIPQESQNLNIPSKVSKIGGFDNVYDYVAQFRDYPILDVEKDNPLRGWAYSILRKDGTWEVIQKWYALWEYREPLNVALVKPEKASEYARTCDGYLRIRRSYYDGIRYNVGGEQSRTYMEYFVLDYLPQKPDLAFSKVMPVTRSANNDYFADIKIAFKNVEGTERILVQQLEEGERVPYSYYMSDSSVKDGYFIATVDKDYHTYFRLLAQNKNGETISEYLTISPLNQRKYNLVSKVEGDILNLSFKDDRNNVDLNKQATGGTLTSLTNPGISTRVMIENNQVNINSLPSGIYVVQVSDKENNPYVSKFTK